jgi:methylated-DNA-[protein]-cysteine S-methyltransferase
MLGVVGVTRRAYTVDGWGTGELWLDGELVLHHVLPGSVISGDVGEDDCSSPPRAFSAGRSRHPYPSEPALPISPGPAPHTGAASPPGESVRRPECPDRTDFASTLCGRLSRHLMGHRVSYEEVEIDLEWATPFQVELVAALRAVPWGEVVTYRELSALAGRPRAPRPAGALCAANPCTLILPCHRVVAADGIGGYGRSGVALKRRLLAIEGVHL